MGILLFLLVLLRLFLLPDFAGIFFLITLNETFFFVVFLC